MSDSILEDLNLRAKKLIREGKYRITQHVMLDHPERNITAVDILESLKIGNLVSLEPRVSHGEQKYSGPDRYRWFGQDTKDRVLRLILSISANVIIISAVEATTTQTERYLAEDEEGLIQSSVGEDERK